MKSSLKFGASLLIVLGLPVSATAGDISVSTSIDYVSEYVFRGVSFARGAVQPGIEISKDGFTAGVWTSVGLGEASSAAGDEIDVYAGYGWSLTDVISADVGATIYHFPDVAGSLFDFGDASTLELYGGLGFDTAFAPSLYGYYDIDLKAFTLEGGVSHSLSVSDSVSLDLGLTAGLVTADGGGDYQYGTVSASYSYAFSDAVSAYIGANYSLSSEDTLQFKVDGNGNAFTAKDNLFWTGVGVAAGF